MKVARKFFFVGSAAAVALICCAGSVGVFRAGVVAPDLQARVDDMALRVTYSLGQWQPASGYVPVEYPTDGSWERMVASNGH